MCSSFTGVSMDDRDTQKESEFTKQHQLVHLNRVLLEVATFLQDYLPLANAHNTDFITHNHWETMLCSQVAEKALLVKNKEIIKSVAGNIDPSSENEHQEDDVCEDETSENLSDKLAALCSCPKKLDSSQRSYTTTCNKDNKDTISCDSTSNETPFVKSDSTSKNDLTTTHLQDSFGRPLIDKDKFTKWNHHTLEDYLSSVKNKTLPELGVLSSLEDVFIGKTEEKDVFIKTFMNSKKCHEVEIMAEICANLAQNFKIEKVIDIGSGRGYLSSSLSLQHGLQVLGVDSSTMNTHSAETRNKRLAKYWDGLVRNARQQAGNEKSEEADKMQHDIQKRTQYEESNSEIVHKDTSSKKTTKKQGIYKPVTQFVTLKTDLVKLMHDAFEENDQSHLSNLTDDKSHIRTSDSVEGHNLSNGSAQMCENTNGIHFMLTGLHTCGDLAANLLKLFIANPSAKILCNVGCCYNHIEEEFVGNPFGGSVVLDREEYGFPLSSLLLAQKFYLGRNARMIAVQSLDRLAAETQNENKDTSNSSERSLFWRALLQVILTDLNSGKVREDWKVGKIAAKSKHFVDYVRKALRKLGFDGTKITDAHIVQYENDYSHYEAKMKTFFQLRAVLGSCIEGLLLMDRLHYLLEQPCVKSAQLVQLFDPVTSPRCYGIIAVKKEDIQERS